MNECQLSTRVRFCHSSVLVFGGQVLVQGTGNKYSYGTVSTSRIGSA
jgi:hypothetical protein